MAPRTNWDTQFGSYLGYLTWTAFGSFPTLTIPLFIKEHPIPMRKPKFSEVYTISQLHSGTLQETRFAGLFQAASDPLQLAISGWVITPTSGNQWAPVDSGGTLISSVGSRPYTEIISGLLSGELNQTSGGAWVRKDPDSYITPYGHLYSKPTIAQWECGMTTNMRKQTFNATLYLES